MNETKNEIEDETENETENEAEARPRRPGGEPGLTANESQLSRLTHHIRDRVRPITCLEDLEVVSCSPESVAIRTRVRKSSLNLRGFAHGGWLFTLCDTASAALVFSRGLDCVTQQASINYLHGGCVGDVVCASVRNLHRGRSTIVNEVTLTNQDGATLAVATLTMFVMGPLEPDRTAPGPA